MADISKLKDRLKQLRKDNNMTQQELASKLGIVRTAIANYETGRTNPDPETLSLIASIFNTSTDYLLGRTDVRQPVESIVKNKDKSVSALDKISEENNLSSESQEELRRYIELLKIRDMTERNADSEVANDLTSIE